MAKLVYTIGYYTMKEIIPVNRLMITMTEIEEALRPLSQLSRLRISYVKKLSE
jgi:hypothetical protein